MDLICIHMLRPDGFRTCCQEHAGICFSPLGSNKQVKTTADKELAKNYVTIDPKFSVFVSSRSAVEQLPV